MARDLGKTQTRNILGAVLNRAPIAGMPGTEGVPGKPPLPASQRETGAVHSSAIAGLGYNERQNRLMITFVTGKTYAYYNVSPQAYRNFYNADSKGRYFNQHIRNGYAYAKLG